MQGTSPGAVRRGCARPAPVTLTRSAGQLAALHADVARLVPHIIRELHAHEAELAGLLGGLAPRRHASSPSSGDAAKDARVEDLVKRTRVLSALLSDQRDLAARCETLRVMLGDGDEKFTNGLDDAYASYRARFDTLSADLHESTCAEQR